MGRSHVTRIDCTTDDRYDLSFQAIVQKCLISAYKISFINQLKLSTQLIFYLGVVLFIHDIVYLTKLKVFSLFYCNFFLLKNVQKQCIV